METSSAEIGSSQTMKFGSERQRARDADALALPAGKLVRIASRHARVEADHSQQFLHPLARGAAARQAMHRQRLAHDLCTVMRGLSEAYGS